MDYDYDEYVWILAVNAEVDQRFEKEEAVDESIRVNFNVQDESLMIDGVSSSNAVGRE